MVVKQKKVIYFVRHGQSIHNALPIFQSVNAPLNEQGKRQASALADRLSTLTFDVLISSPLPRARETAEYISLKTTKDIEFSDLFVECIKPTEIDGKPFTDQAANRVWRKWQESLYRPGLRVSDGENYNDIIRRVDKALDLLSNRPEAVFAVVTHGYFLRAILARILVGSNLNGAIMRQIQQRASMKNTGITVLDYRDAFEEDFAWRLWSYNDHAHFAE